MAEAIDFPCPACGVPLRLPLELAGVSGPCPACGRQITAPTPDATADASLDFLDVRDMSAASAETIASTRSRRSAGATLACAFFGVAAFSAGYLLRPPAADREVLADPARAEVALAGFSPSLPEVGETPPAPAPSPARHARTLDSAEAALRAFLNAPDWRHRLLHTLYPDLAGPAMEARAAVLADGPTSFGSLTVSLTQIDAHSREALLIFQVATADFPKGVPVAVMESDDGWRVDWHAFSEFFDDRFRKFADSPPDSTGRFHLIVHPPETPAAGGHLHFDSYLIGPPMAGRDQIAFVRRGSAASSAIRSALAARGLFAPVLEIAKREAPDGRTYLEILEVIAPTWRPGRR